MQKHSDSVNFRQNSCNPDPNVMWTWLSTKSNRFLLVKTAPRKRNFVKSRQQLWMKKKRSARSKHCVLAVVRWSQNFLPRCRPPFRGCGWPKFNQLETVTTFTYKPSLVEIDACNFVLSW